MKNIFTVDEEKKICELYLQYKSAKEIIDIMGKGHSTTIYRIIKRNNVYRKPTNTEIMTQRLSGYKELEMEICEYYQNNFTTAMETGKHFGLRQICILNILHKYNIDIRKPSDFVKKYSVNENYFENIDSSEKAYILGFLFADGNIGNNNSKVQISLQEEDKYILEYMNSCFQSDHPLIFRPYHEKYPNRKNQYMLTIENKIFHDNLLNCGLVPNKSLIAKFPNIPEIFIKSFILGYFDGDGCIYISKTPYTTAHISFVGTYEMMISISDYIYKSTGLKFNIYPGQNRKYKDPTKNTFTIQGGGNPKIKKFLDWLYKDECIFLKRKYEKYYNYYYSNNSLSA